MWLKTFVDTYSKYNSAENIALHCQSNHSEHTLSKEIENPKITILAAQSNKRVVAYAQVRWLEHPQCVVANMPGEIQRFYVDRCWYGKGIAQQLMVACLKELEGRIPILYG